MLPSVRAVTDLADNFFWMRSLVDSFAWGSLIGLINIIGISSDLGGRRGVPFCDAKSPGSKFSQQISTWLLPEGISQGTS